jgi:Flp pilus assembly protein TadG
MKQVLWMYKLRFCERGVTAIEFAIVMPFVILLTFGTIQIALNFSNKIQVNHAVGVVARELAIGDLDDSTAQIIKGNAETLLEKTIKDGLYTISHNSFEITSGQESITFEFTYDDPLITSFGLENLGWGTLSLSVNIR